MSSTERPGPRPDSIRRILAGIPLTEGGAPQTGADIVKTILAEPPSLKVSFVYDQHTPQERIAFEAIVSWELRKLVGVEDVQLYAMTPAQAHGQPAKPIGQGRPAHGPPKPAPEPQASIPGVRSIIAVASGKGGVGKSTVAVNLAAALNVDGHRVGILDADIYGPSLPIMLGLEGQLFRTPEGKIRPLERFGLKVMSIGFAIGEETPVIWRGLMVMKMIKQFLLLVEWGELDYLIIDLPPGTGDTQLTIVQTVRLTGAVVVTTPQDVALADARRGFEMFRSVGVPVLGIIENMSTFICPGCGHEERIFSQGGGRRTAETLSVPFLGEVPLNGGIRQSGDAGKPYVIEHPGTPDARVFREIASRVAEGAELLAGQSPAR